MTPGGGPGVAAWGGEGQAAGRGSAVLGGGHPEVRQRWVASQLGERCVDPDKEHLSTHSHQFALSEDSNRNKTALPTKGKKAHKRGFFSSSFSHEGLGLVANQDQGGSLFFKGGL